MDASERRGFQDKVDLCFGAIDMTNVNRTEMEIERQSEKSQTFQIYTNILTIRYVCMKMHEHVMCKVKSIMDSAQSKPTSTQIVQHV